MESLQDPKVRAKFEEIKRTDKSFTKELRFMGLTTKYSQREARDIWLRGIAYGLEEGIRLFTIEGQRLDLYNSCKTAKQQEFLAKSFELCDRFGMQVVYSPTDGMVVVETGRRAVVVTPTPIVETTSQGLVTFTPVVKHAGNCNRCGAEIRILKL